MLGQRTDLHASKSGASPSGRFSPPFATTVGDAWRDWPDRLPPAPTCVSTGSSPQPRQGGASPLRSAPGRRTPRSSSSHRQGSQRPVRRTWLPRGARRDGVRPASREGDLCSRMASGSWHSSVIDRAGDGLAAPSRSRRERVRDLAVAHAYRYPLVRRTSLAAAELRARRSRLLAPADDLCGSTARR